MKSKTLSLVAGLALLFAGSAGAVTINQGLTSGVLNTIEDQDREAFVDVDGSGTITVGDVFVGFVRVDDFGPSGQETNDQVYAIVSTQITAIFNADGEADPSGTVFSFGATTEIGLRMEDLTGDANTAGGMFAVYDSPTPIGNLIGAPVGDGMQDNTDLIAEYTLRLVGGIANDTDFLTGVNLPVFGGGSATDALVGLDTSVDIGSFFGGLSILFNNTNFEYDATVQSIDPLQGLVLSQFGIGEGSVAGSGGATGESIFTDASGYGDFTQCLVDGVSVACGVTTSANFFVRPVAVPEPASLLLMGLGLLGLAAVRRRKNAL